MTSLKVKNDMASKHIFLNKRAEPLSVAIATKSPSPSFENRIIDSRQLLNNEGKVAILHHGEIYQLKQTRSGKLILTK